MASLNSFPHCLMSNSLPRYFSPEQRNNCQNIADHLRTVSLQKSADLHAIVYSCYFVCSNYSARPLIFNKFDQLLLCEMPYNNDRINICVIRRKVFGFWSDIHIAHCVKLCCKLLRRAYNRTGTSQKPCLSLVFNNTCLCDNELQFVIETASNTIKSKPCIPCDWQTMKMI